ncbi:MAG TPA: alpha-galactosidase [Ferrovibrio sp.]|uniref:alpha-galactosidase n=1 Tax=Ferrovibrio sp. TaxID=1917215 RepID=UPI002ED416AA
MAGRFPLHRRDFLAVSATLAGGASLSRLAWAQTGAQTETQAGTRAPAKAAAPLESRVWICPSARYVVTLDGPALAIDCFAPDAPHGPAVKIADDADGPMVAVGSRRSAVSWRLASWDEPDSFAQRLVLQAEDEPLDAEVQLAYDAASGILSRRTLLRHRGGPDEVDIRATLGFAFSLHEPVEQIVHLTGRWMEEFGIRRIRPGAAAISLESRAGKTGFAEQPYVALRAGAATYLCQILWSGNWSLDVIPHAAGATLLGGFSNWRFRHRLRAGDSLALPEVLFGRFEGGLDAATRRLHDYRRAHRPDPDRIIPVQYNSWYPYPGEPTATALLPLVPQVKALGCEAFVVDAGWYRTDEGESEAGWDQRTGDWHVSRLRFPNGLRELAERCRDAGLLFGLWFEPEVIAPASAIRSAHPEWLHHIDGHLPPADQRAVLHLGVPAARRHVFDRVTRLLRLIGVDWLKWDFNASIGAGGWAPTLPKDLISEAPLVSHYKGLYQLLDDIRAAFPDLIIEMCAGGGGRMDGGILSHAHLNWISDQPVAVKKLAIHFGTRLAHPPVVCNDWLIDWPGGAAGADERAAMIDPRGDLAFRLRAAMLGSFGISAPINRWLAADTELAAAHIALYKARLRAIIHHGDQYALTPAPGFDGSAAGPEDGWAAMWYAAKDGLSGALFAFRLAGGQARRRFALPGLQAARRYRVTFFPDHASEAGGAELAAGLDLALSAPFRSELCMVEALPG